MSQICIHEQLRGLVQENSWTIKQFAAETGLPYRTAQDYLNGKRMPGCESLAQIATSLRVNLDWLVFGEGPRERGGDEKVEGQGQAPAQRLGLEAAQREEGQRARDELDLGTVATLARLGTAGVSWQILEGLLKVFPGSLSFEDLKGAVDEEPRQLAAHLTRLQQLGFVYEAEAGSYRLTDSPRLREVHSESLGDRHQVTLKAAGVLIQDILPAVAAGTGKIAILEGLTGDGEGLMAAWKQGVYDLANAAANVPGESDAFTIVVALATDVGDS